ncbi:hypothetical protein O6H91_11G086800 [Diphasiastrum complanatum]|uniref:Uncharacterized protein n=1 Tax=Diphasiastrum complanatum TaxID=34168 RepID=A0ACC2CCD8_DIPCM|nr:hypothetical protein O6H91_11G086800 [Diphasiastrum complanatum]
MTCSSFLLLSTAEFMIPSGLFCLRPVSSTAFVRSALTRFSRHSSRRLSLCDTQFLRPVFKKHDSDVTMVDWTTHYAKNGKDFVQDYAAGISAREPNKIQQNHIKRKTKFLGAYELSELVAPHFFDRGLPMGIAAGIGTVAAVFVMLVLGFWAKSTENEGSVSDLVKRGQLRFDRKADSTPLKYDDPFNNPMVKAGSKNPLVRMCGKIFRLAPVTLTEEKVVSHQNRRLQAYQWKRPVVFLNEGDSVPNGVDPEEVRWIPSNHPFATTTNYIDEDSAQKNVYQTRGVPARVRAEHEALRKKMMEAAQNETEPWSSQPSVNASIRDPLANNDSGHFSTQNNTLEREEAIKVTIKCETEKAQLSESHEFPGSHLRSIDGTGQEHISSHTQQRL